MAKEEVNLRAATDEGSSSDIGANTIRPIRVDDLFPPSLEQTTGSTPTTIAASSTPKVTFANDEGGSPFLSWEGSVRDAPPQSDPPTNSSSSSPAEPGSKQGNDLSSPPRPHDDQEVLEGLLKSFDHNQDTLRRGNRRGEARTFPTFSTIFERPRNNTTPNNNNHESSTDTNLNPPIPVTVVEGGNPVTSNDKAPTGGPTDRPAPVGILKNKKTEGTSPVLSSNEVKIDDLTDLGPPASFIPKPPSLRHHQRIPSVIPGTGTIPKPFKPMPSSAGGRETSNHQHGGWMHDSQEGGKSSDMGSHSSLSPQPFAGGERDRSDTWSTISNPPQEVPRPRPIHERMISWDINVTEYNPVSNRISQRKITVDDVLQHNPYESEAETRVMQAVESLEGSGTSSREALSDLGMGILPCLPNEAEAAFSALSQPIGGSDSTINTSGAVGDNMGLGRAELHRQTSSRRPPPISLRAQSVAHAEMRQNRHHRRQLTMEQRLDGLSSALESIMVDGDSHGHSITEMVPETPMEMGQGSVETMNNFANVLYQRRKKSVDVGRQGEDALLNGDVSNHDVLPNLYDTSGHNSTASSTGNNNNEPDDIEAGGHGDKGSIRDLENDDNPNSKSTSHHLASLRQPLVNSRCGVCLHRIPIVREFVMFIAANDRAMKAFVMMLLWIIFPALCAAFILFYLAGNPPTGRIKKVVNSTIINHRDKPVDPTSTSASFWILFICVRQLITLSMAFATQSFLIDFVCIGRQWTARYLGPIGTLLIVQSKGWPFIITWWAIYGLSINYGKHENIGFFGKISSTFSTTGTQANFRVLIVAFCVGIIVSIKRTWIGFFLGRKTYVNYAADLAKVMKKTILLSKVAYLAKEIEKEYVIDGDGKSHRKSKLTSLGVSHEKLAFLLSDALSDERESDGNESYTRGVATSNDDSPYVIDPSYKDKYTGALTDAQRARVTTLLGEWEEPENKLGVEENVSVNAIIKFRQSLAFIDSPFMFSYAFGLVETRESCIESAQEVYLRLLLDDASSDVLSFDAIATLALRSDGTFHQELLKDYIKLLRPDRDGRLSLIDFVKSVDFVYKQARLLRASVKNAQKIDRAFELLFNVVFYFVVIAVILSQVGMDPIQMFVSFSGIIVAFAFMIGAASAKYFEGLLFILAQRPYDIGDRINLEGANIPGNTAGSTAWIVQDVTLFTTTIVLAATNEVATVSNGALANSRIINGARSKHAIVLDYLRFGIDVPFERIQVFREALTQFVKARPREWMNLLGFRSMKIQHDLGFVEYIIIVQHRASWQYFVQIRASLGELQSFCMELSKKLEMHYKSPPLPVNIFMGSSNDGKLSSDDEKDLVSKVISLPGTSDELRKSLALLDQRLG